jgi:hypothetical protein
MKSHQIEGRAASSWAGLPCAKGRLIIQMLDGKAIKAWRE